MPPAVAVNVKVALVVDVDDGGPDVSVVSGGVGGAGRTRLGAEPTYQLPISKKGSGPRLLSEVRTAKTCSPAANPEYVAGSPGHSEADCPSSAHW